MSATKADSGQVCKYYMVGFCKFRDKCLFKHVLENCKTKDCKKDQCLKRHPIKCKYFFLRRSCKFKIDCKFSHESDTKDVEEIEKVRREIIEIQKKNDSLKAENKELKK